MIEQIRYVITKETNPYKNLALEEMLFYMVGEKECILYLWQNEKTVVIGRNQNPWKECRVDELEAVGGRLVRRLSGGGAVFHDLGNLNFTFLVRKDNYNVEKQLEVIVKAVQNLGIPAEKSGRNDITVEGRKFSGNAFYREGDHCYHHGTILIQVDMSQLSRYLNVSQEKLVSKGVNSVRSRVINLVEYRPELTIHSMQKALLGAFGEVYGLTPAPIELEKADTSKLSEFEEKFASWDWKFGKAITFTNSIGRRYSWGEVELHFVVISGKIAECIAYSDALETSLFDKIAKGLIGCPYKGTEMVQAIENVSWQVDGSQNDTISPIEDINTRGSSKEILRDISSLLQES